MLDDMQELPLDEKMCIEQFKTMLDFVFMSQGLPETEKVCETAREASRLLFDGLNELPDNARYPFLVYLAYLSMNISANVSFLISLIEIEAELEGK